MPIVETKVLFLWPHSQIIVMMAAVCTSCTMTLQWLCTGLLRAMWLISMIIGNHSTAVYQSNLTHIQLLVEWTHFFQILDALLVKFKHLPQSFSKKKKSRKPLCRWCGYLTSPARQISDMCEAWTSHLVKLSQRFLGRLFFLLGAISWRSRVLL